MWEWIRLCKKQTHRWAVGCVKSRKHIWAPVIDYPTLGLRRLYQWICADLWWGIDCLPLAELNAMEIAKADAVGFSVLAKQIESLQAQSEEQLSTIGAADLLVRRCNEFDKLLEFSADDEEVIHQWLNRDENHIFLDPSANKIWSKIKFGDKTSDFVIQRHDGTYLLVEIEKPSTQILKASDQEPTASFNHACNQVRDWQRYVRENIHTARNELGLTGIYEPDGLVVAGLSSQINSDSAQNRWQDLKNNHEFDILTFDELSSRVRIPAHRIRNVSTGTTTT